ncbi:MAG: polymerase sigma70 factor [Paenibacillaceae bacterium]|jgi:RNA polymerase sigma-70 factor (ECF subfamily)|nr:polymerase sigma70 factor [Paenibacillaceae bacterium]
MEQLTDEQLISQVRQGNMDAFTVLVDRHKNGVFQFIRCRVEVRETAEDLAQEVFLKLYRHLPDFRGDARFSSWLYSLTLNTVRDHLRMKKRRPVTTVLEALKGWFTDSREEPEAEAVRSEERHTVIGVLAGLPLKYREVLYLYHYRQMAVSEIAPLLQIPEKTAETRLYRGKQLLKERWLEVDKREDSASQRHAARAVPEAKADS